MARMSMQRIRMVVYLCTLPLGTITTKWLGFCWTTARMRMRKTSTTARLWIMQYLTTMILCNPYSADTAGGVTRLAHNPTPSNHPKPQPLTLRPHLPPRIDIPSNQPPHLALMRGLEQDFMRESADRFHGVIIIVVWACRSLLIVDCESINQL